MFSCDTNNKTTHIQKVLQILRFFKAKMTMLVLFLIGAMALVTVAYFAFQVLHESYRKKHRTALANLQLEVFDGVLQSVSSEGLENRMRAHLPQLEALAHLAPRNDNGVTDRILASWRVQLCLEDSLVPKPSNAWDRLFLAKRMISLGNGRGAAEMLSPLRKSADPSQVWSATFWSTLLMIDQLNGDRNQGWKDLEDYKIKFKQDAKPELEQMMAGI
jgi:hypothetical protein